ncbi:hypothetical protein BH24PSE2_BH24PSE2_04620 [soil metagenome]
MRKQRPSTFSATALRLATAPALAAIVSLASAQAAALETLRLEIGDVTTAFGSAESVVLSLDLNTGATPAASLLAESITVPGLSKRLHDIRLDCASLLTGGGRIACRDARLRADVPFAGPQNARGTLLYSATNGLDVRLHDLQLADARLEIDVQATSRAWTAAVRSSAIDVAELASLVAQLDLIDTAADVGGRIELELEAHGGRGTVERLEARIDARNLSGSEPSGRLAFDGLDIDGIMEARYGDDGWRFDACSAANAGQLYAEPWFIEPGKEAVSLAARGAWSGPTLKLDEWSLRHEGAVQVSGAAVVAVKPELAVTSARIRIAEALFPAAYHTWLQPLLYGSPLDALDTAGRIDGDIVLADGRLQQVALAARDLHVDDTGGRFAIYGLDGAIRWGEEETPRTSRLAWDGGFVFGVGFGAATVVARSGRRAFRLLEPLALPVLEGALRVNELSASGLGSAALELNFDADLDPVDMRALTAALGWPPFAGRLSGRIPDLSYGDGVVTLGGDLTARVFDGAITVRNLRLREPFGRLPRFAADATLRGLDLDALTNTFDIGRIEGRLDGDIEDLRLLRWKPVAFHARFYTPPGDDARHRISQRAVENISSIGGGGAAAALSSGFLRFFESFAYARLGLGCRLENGVCHMQGISPAPDGYYIVIGKWLPRIDVIGHAERVDWPVLIEQLQSLEHARNVTVR